MPSCQYRSNFISEITSKESLNSQARVPQLTTKTLHIDDINQGKMFNINSNLSLHEIGRMFHNCFTKTCTNLHLDSIFSNPYEIFHPSKMFLEIIPIWIFNPTSKHTYCLLSATGFSIDVIKPKLAMLIGILDNRI